MCSDSLANIFSRQTGLIQVCGQPSRLIRGDCFCLDNAKH